MCLPFSASSEGRIRNLGLGSKIGTFWDHFGTLVPFGTKSRIWDLFGAPEEEKDDLRKEVGALKGEKKEEGNTGPQD